MPDPQPVFVLDADPLIPTGVAATAEQVAAMIADPDSPVTEATVPLLVPEQQPTPEQVEAAAAGDLFPS